LGHPSYVQQVSLLGNVTARHCNSGRQPNFAALNRGRHLYSAGRRSSWALAHILVLSCFFLLSFFPRLISAVVLHAARWKWSSQKLAKNSLSGHHRTTLLGYIFAIKACVDNWKKNLLNRNISPHVLTIWCTSAH